MPTTSPSTTPATFCPRGSASGFLDHLCRLVSIPSPAITETVEHGIHVATLTSAGKLVMQRVDGVSMERALGKLADALRDRAEAARVAMATRGFLDWKRDQPAWDAIGRELLSKAAWSKSRASAAQKAAFSALLDKRASVCRELLTTWMAARAMGVDAGEIESGFAVNGTVAA